MGICERMMRIDAPADVVWAWLSEPRNLFGVDMMHAAVHLDDAELRPGAVVAIDYDVLGLYRQRHHASVREVQPYFVAFGVDKVPNLSGRDPFPHSQSYRVVPLDGCACILVNCVAGHFAFRGSAVLGERLFRRVMPAVLDDHNQLVAVGCGAMAPGKLRRPAGLVGLMSATSGRLGRRSTRTALLERVKTDRAMAYPATSGADGDAPAAWVAHADAPVADAPAAVGDGSPTESALPT
jgi:hypothetical protein